MVGQHSLILDEVLKLFVDPKNSRGKQVVARGIESRFKFEHNGVKIHFQQGYLNELESMGLVTHNGRTFDQRTYYITQIGIDTLKEGGITAYHKMQKEKALLENKILHATVNSHQLNKIQMWITIILATGTIIALILQLCAYQSDKAKNDLEIEKLKIELNELRSSG